MLAEKIYREKNKAPVKVLCKALREKRGLKIRKILFFEPVSSHETTLPTRTCTNENKIKCLFFQLIAFFFC
jgi:hypothetical protein